MTNLKLDPNLVRFLLGLLVTLVGAATTYISEVVQSPNASVPPWLIYMTPLLLVGLGMAKDVVQDHLKSKTPPAPAPEVPAPAPQA